MGAPSRADAPEGGGLFRRLREALRRARRVAVARRPGPLPAPQGHGSGLFAQPAGRPAGRHVPLHPRLHVGLDGRGDLSRARLPADGQRPALAALPQRRNAGHHRRADDIQGARAHHPYHQRTAQVHAEHAGDAAPGAGRPRTLADDWLSLHASDPQLMPESNLRFVLSAALVASVYLGDSLSFAVYAMAAQPELYKRIRAEADALFANGDPDAEDFNPASMDVTHRFLMECLRMYPIVPMSMRDVMNSFVMEGHEIPVGSRIYIAQTASHYMEDIFPDPFSFDIDRYASPRDEHRNPGYAPYGLGTHRCLGARWMDLQLAVNVLMIAHYFTL
ncbi:MAG: cytochrome P450, partial [bacterium]|nr:cytochrome P450 [bacterium]